MKVILGSDIREYNSFIIMSDDNFNFKFPLEEREGCYPKHTFNEEGINNLIDFLKEVKQRMQERRISKKILTSFINQDLKICDYDYMAYYEGEEKGGARGWGSTPERAMKDLTEIKGLMEISNAK